MVFVEKASERRRKALLGERQDTPHYLAARGVRDDFVADAYRVPRFYPRAVHVHVAGTARPLCVAPRFEAARGEKEAVDPDARETRRWH